MSSFQVWWRLRARLLPPASSYSAALAYPGRHMTQPCCADRCMPYTSTLLCSAEVLLTSTRCVAGFLNHVTGLWEYCFRCSRRLSVDSTNLHRRSEHRPQQGLGKRRAAAQECWWGGVHCCVRSGSSDAVFSGSWLTRHIYGCSLFSRRAYESGSLGTPTGLPTLLGRVRPCSGILDSTSCKERQAQV